MLNFFFLLTDFSSVLRKKIKINDKMSSFNNFQKLNRVRIANNLFFSTKLVQKAGHRFFYKPLLFRFRFKYSKMFFLLNLKNSRTAAAAVNQTNLTRSTGFHTYPFFFQPNFRINLNKN